MLWLEVHNNCSAENIPSKEHLEFWITATLAGQPAEIGISLVEAKEIQQLNKTYRNIDKITDVLSFTADTPVLDDQLPYLGDIAICVERLRQDAKELQKKEIEHWAHIIIHSVLHLLGYDHTKSKDQQEMHQLENQIMQDLKLAAPWQVANDSNS